MWRSVHECEWEICIDSLYFIEILQSFSIVTIISNIHLYMFSSKINVQMNENLILQSG